MILKEYEPSCARCNDGDGEICLRCHNWELDRAVNPLKKHLEETRKTAEHYEQAWRDAHIELMRKTNALNSKTNELDSYNWINENRDAVVKLLNDKNGRFEDELALVKTRLSMATEFDSGPVKEVNGKPFDPKWRDAERYHYRISKRGPSAWVILDYVGSVLSKTGEWLYEPQPSSRTDEFLTKTRFASADEAFAALEQYKNK